MTHPRRAACSLHLLGLVVLVAAVACSDAADPAAAAAGTPDVAGLADTPIRFGGDSASDLATTPGDSVVSDGSVASDGSDDSKVDPGCDFPDDPAKGEPGSICEVAGDCDSGYCVDGPEGKRCTRTCVSCCPKGWACEAAPGSDTLFLCVPKLKALCRPCGSDAFCANLAAGALCLGDGEAGAFCGGACVEGADCPGGYACELAQGLTGAAKQCVRTAGPCACSPAAIAAGDSTPCSASNAHGTCKGSRKCTIAGLSACDAATPAAEVCNGGDDDCDGQVDEGLAGAPCASSNAHGTCAGLTTCDGAVIGCTAATALAETCNGQDDDCDGVIDEGLSGQPCAVTTSAGSCKGLTTCNGAVALCDAPTPTAEACNGGDDDCDGQADEGFVDSDNDGLADCVDPDDDNDGVADGADCAPLDLAISPSATEACNGKDDDCDGVIDEEDAKGCTNFYSDDDSDGFGAAATLVCLCKASAAKPVQVAGDCDDADPSVHPAAVEACNGKDDDCDGSVDEIDATGCATAYFDADSDGFGLAGNKACLCVQSGKYTASKAGDCDDGDAAISPAALEACNGKDDNCDGSVDEEKAKGCASYYVDGDNDGYGKDGSGLCLCQKSATHTATVAGDCDDGDSGASPKAKEVCNGKDDNCDGNADEADAVGCGMFWADVDQDGYGKSSDTACLCKAKAPYTASKAGDCDDGLASVSPTGNESCNGKDDDCDGNIDPAGAKGCTAYFVDQDKDGFGDAYAPTKCLCSPVAPHLAIKPGDCNDNDAGIHLGAAEICNGKDDDCDGAVDEIGAKGCIDYFVDSDKDGFGLDGTSQCMCKASPPFSATKGGDCNDGTAQISPAIKELCNDKDDNCDGQVDEGVGKATYYLDADNDSHGKIGSGKALCAPEGDYKVKVAGDCDDGNGGIHPGATEVCNGKDDDCNGSIDDNAAGLVTYYLDNDGDGWGVAGSSQPLCFPTGKYSAKNSGDCNDSDAAVHPAASEVNCNGKDDDCKGGDNCPTQCTGLCGGKCNVSSAVGQAQICTLWFLGICLEYKTSLCYCDAACVGLGDCCPGRETCCK